jgi:hypothetical protein
VALALWHCVEVVDRGTRPTQQNPTSLYVLRLLIVSELPEDLFGVCLGSREFQSVLGPWAQYLAAINQRKPLIEPCLGEIHYLDLRAAYLDRLEGAKVKLDEMEECPSGVVEAGGRQRNEPCHR